MSYYGVAVISFFFFFVFRNILNYMKKKPTEIWFTGLPAALQAPWATFWCLYMEETPALLHLLQIASCF